MWRTFRFLKDDFPVIPYLQVTLCNKSSRRFSSLSSLTDEAIAAFISSFGYNPVNAHQQKKNQLQLVQYNYDIQAAMVNEIRTKCGVMC